jgi:phosphoglycerate dehydrogenase-like enzyme
MLNVLVTRPFTDAQIERLRAVSAELLVTREKPETADYSRADILYAMVPPRELDKAPNLKWVQLHLAGIDALHNHPAFTQSNIALTTSSGVHAFGVAEYAFTMMLALAHRIRNMVNWQETERWPGEEQRRVLAPTDLRGKTLGIIGYGSIGRELARLAKGAFNMRVVVTKRDPSQRADNGYSPPGIGDPEGLLPDEWLAPDRLHDLLTGSDVVVMCAPLTGDTHHLLDAAAFAAMKPSAYFINVGRGQTVDERALVEALAQKQIAGAAIDVYEQEPYPEGGPLFALDNVILSPHVSGFINGMDDRCCDLFAENLRRYLAEEPLLNLVDREKGY